MAEAARRDATDDIAEQVKALREDLAKLAETVGDLAVDEAEAFNGRVRRKADRLVKKGRKVARNAAARGRKAVDGLEHAVEAEPLVSVAVAFGVGMVIGRLMQR